MPGSGRGPGVWLQEISEASERGAIELGQGSRQGLWALLCALRTSWACWELWRGAGHKPHPGDIWALEEGTYKQGNSSCREPGGGIVSQSESGLVCPLISPGNEVTEPGEWS